MTMEALREAYYARRRHWPSITEGALFEGVEWQRDGDAAVRRARGYTLRVARADGEINVSVIDAAGNAKVYR